MSKIGLIIEREYMTRVKKKSFLILTFLMPLLLVGLIAGTLALSMLKSDQVKTITVSDENGLYFNRLKSNDQYKFIPAKGDFESLKKQVSEDTDIYAYLAISGNLITDSSNVSLYSKKQIEMELKDFVTNQLKEIARGDKIASYRIEGLDKIIEASKMDVKIQTIKLDEDGAEKQSSSELAMVIGLVATMIIYIFIFAYGAMVMNGVMEEKLNRIVEVIVSSVKPFDLMMGKIIGIAMVGLTQVLLWVVLIGGIAGITSIALNTTGDTDKIKQFGSEMVQNQGISSPVMNSVNVQEMTAQSDGGQAQIQQFLTNFMNVNWGEIIFWFILYFLGGYLLYASLFAAFGSAIDNQEDSQQFVLPLTIPVLFALYAGMYSVQNPDGPLAFWCSMFPLTSPIVMMVRIPFGVPVWQLILSFGLLALTFVGVVKMAAKIYRTGILMYGKKVTYKELFKWLRYKN
jgi:ABC-2 type transport system permease protein